MLDEHAALAPDGELRAFYSDDAYGLLRRGLEIARDPAQKTLVLSIARKASFANTKKINTVVDTTKTPRPVRVLFKTAIDRFSQALEELNSEADAVGGGASPAQKLLSTTHPSISRFSTRRI